MRDLILVTDDDRLQRALLRDVLEDAGYQVETCANGSECLAALERSLPVAVCLDLKMPGMSGLEVLVKARERNRDVPVVILTGLAEVDVVVQAMQLGAFDFLVKPVEVTKLVTTVRNAAERYRMSRRLAELEREMAFHGHPTIAGRSIVMRDLFRQIDRVAGTDVTVLLVGESGTGKELVARAIHAASPRAGGQLVALNCAAIPESLQESELFGHERGAFTGAMDRRKGRFELADGGTLFLDEVAELSASAQAKLLRVLEEKSFTRLGGAADLRSDFRLLATTHQNLENLVATRRFREDLYFRVAVFEIVLPPLRERGEDVLLLAAKFATDFGTAAGRPAMRLAAEAADLLRAYSWPGNVRELENAVQRAVVVCDGEVIRPSDLPDRVRQTTAPRPVAVADPAGAAERPVAPVPAPSAALPDEPVTLAELERRAIESALRQSAGNLTLAAQRLGIGRSTLYRKVRELRLEGASDAAALDPLPSPN